MRLFFARIHREFAPFLRRRHVEGVLLKRGARQLRKGIHHHVECRAGADRVAYACGILRVIAINLRADRFAGDRCAQQPATEIPQAQLRQLCGMHHLTHTHALIREDDGTAHRHRFERAARLGENEIVLRQHTGGLAGLIARLLADHIQRYTASSTRGGDGCGFRTGRGVVAEDRRAARSRGQAGALCVAPHVDAILDHVDLVFGDSAGE